MDFINKQNIAGFKIRKNGRQITRFRQNRARGHTEIHPQLAAHNLGERGFSQAGRAIKQRVIHGFAALARRLDKDF